MEQDLLTILIPAVIVLAPIAYLVLSERQQLSGESRRNLRTLALCLEGTTTDLTACGEVHSIAY